MSARPARDLARIRFFVDEDLAGVGLGLMRLRPDVVTGSHDPVTEVIPRKDEEWIPAVPERGWVAITNDRHIRTQFYERATGTTNLDSHRGCHQSLRGDPGPSSVSPRSARSCCANAGGCYAARLRTALRWSSLNSCHNR